MELRWKRNIALFMLGQGITLFGSMLVHYAVMWHITVKTQSGVMMTLITAAGALPMVFISPLAGAWADRYNKKAIINIADATIAAVTLVLAIVFSLGVDLPELMLICLVMRSLGQGVQMPAVNALIPEIVPQENLIRINGISGSIQSMVMFASPMAGAVLLSVAPIQTLMYVDVITAAIGISILLFLIKTPAHTKTSEEKAGARRHFSDIQEGTDYIRRHAFLRKMLILNGVYNILVAPAAVMTPLQVVRNWGDDVIMLGSLAFGSGQRLAAIEVCFSVGMVIGGLVMGAWGGFKNKSHSMALSISFFGIGAVGLGVIPDFLPYLACMVVTGLVMSLFGAPLMATIQTNVEASYMGRVFSVLGMMGSLMMPLGMLIWGPLGEVVSIDLLLVATGVCIFLLGFVFLFDKTLLKAGEPSESD